MELALLSTPQRGVLAMSPPPDVNHGGGGDDDQNWVYPPEEQLYETVTGSTSAVTRDESRLLDGM
jgi:hypothetical protein